MSILTDPIDESKLTPETLASLELSSQLTDEIMQLVTSKNCDICVVIAAAMNMIQLATRQPVQAGDQAFCGMMASLMRAMGDELENSGGRTRI